MMEAQLTLRLLEVPDSNMTFEIVRVALDQSFYKSVSISWAVEIKGKIQTCLGQSFNKMSPSVILIIRLYFVSFLLIHHHFHFINTSPVYMSCTSYHQSVILGHV